MTITTEQAAVLRDTLRQALSGRGAHVLTAEVFDGLAWESAGARPEGAPHTTFQILNHLVYWQEFALRWLDGHRPETPEHAAESWPGPAAPGSGEEWEGAVERFKAGLADFERRSSGTELFSQLEPKTALEIIQLVASHNSYHAGQVALLRRMLDAWPPPSGGATW